MNELTPKPPRNAMIATTITVTMNRVLPTPLRTASGGGATDCSMGGAMAPSVYNHSRAASNRRSRGGPSDASLDDVEPRLEELVRDVEGGDVPDPALPAREHDDAVLVRVLHDRVPDLRVRRLPFRVRHELRDVHQPDAPVVPDDVEPLLHRVQAGGHPLTEARRVRDEPFLVHDIERRHRGCARDGVPAKGVAVRPLDPEVELCVEHRGPDRDPAPEGLRESDNIGDDALALHGEHLPRPSDARLDLVRDQEDVVLLRDLRDPGEPARRRDDVPALPLDRLHEDP